MNQIQPVPPDNSQSPMNIVRSLARLGGDRSLLHDLATFYLEDKDELLNGLSAGLANEDAKTAARCAHSLSGLSANFAADTCAAVAKSIEEACLRNDFEAGRQLLSGLHAEVARLVDALTREILTT